VDGGNRKYFAPSWKSCEQKKRSFDPRGTGGKRRGEKGNRPGGCEQLGIAEPSSTHGWTGPDSGAWWIAGGEGIEKVSDQCSVRSKPVFQNPSRGRGGARSPGGGRKTERRDAPVAGRGGASRRSMQRGAEKNGRTHRWSPSFLNPLKKLPSGGGGGGGGGGGFGGGRYRR